MNAITRRRQLAQRPIDAYSQMSAFTGASIEASRPVHVALGSVAPGNDSTLAALASAQLAFYVAQQASLSDAPGLVSVSEVATLPLATDTLQQAYAARGLLNRFRPTQVRWYPAGERSLALAAGLMALQHDEKLAANWLIGGFGMELALVAEAAQRRAQPVVAGSIRLEGQAVAYAFADYPIIGEEVFAASGYLSQQRRHVVRNTVQDALRWVVAALLAGLFVYALLQPILLPAGA